MGHSRDDKTKSHQRIVEIAAARMRESGTAGPGVAEIMREAGLTHGGFYKHFGSRDELVAAAVEAAFTDGDEVFAKAVDGADDPLAAFVDMYTSAEHRDQPEGGCGVVAFGAEAARAPGPVRTAYRGRVERFLAEIESVLEGDDAEVRQRAVVSLSALVGSVLLSRAVDDRELSDEILRDVSRAVKAQSLRG